MVGVSVQSINDIEKGGDVSKSVACKTFAEFTSIEKMKHELNLRKEEISSINKFIEKLSLYIYEISKDRRIQILNNRKYKKMDE